MEDLEPREDYKFPAELTWDSEGRALQVPCKLFLPKRVRDRPRVVLYPDRHTWHYLARASNCELRGTVGDGPGCVTIVGMDARIGGGSQRHWGAGLDESYLLCHPAKLKTIRNMGPGANSSMVRFYLTDSLLLAPSDLVTYGADGNVEVQPGRRFETRLGDRCDLHFLHEYRYDLEDPKERRSWTELVAEAQIAPSLDDPIETLLPDLDDFLLLISLAEGRRCACMEVSSRQATNFVRLFRLDRSLPQTDGKHSVNDCLIRSYEDLAAFLDTAFTTLQNSPERELLWSALAAITWFESSTIGSDFLRLFTAIESMVLAFRRMNSLEFAVVDAAERGRLQKDVRTLLKSHELLSSSPERRLCSTRTSRGCFASRYDELSRPS